MKLNARDFPDTVSHLSCRQTLPLAICKLKLEHPSIHDRYSVFLENNSTRAVVGYSIKWQCFDDRGEIPDRDLSMIGISIVLFRGFSCMAKNLIVELLKKSVRHETSRIILGARAPSLASSAKREPSQRQRFWDWRAAYAMRAGAPALPVLACRLRTKITFGQGLRFDSPRLSWPDRYRH